MMINLDNLIKVKVSQLANKNQFVVHYVGEDGTDYRCFQSYDTLIAIWTTTPEYKHELYLSWKYWDYSKTTLKHLKLFLNTFTCCEYVTKQQFINLIKKGDIILF